MQAHAQILGHQNAEDLLFTQDVNRSRSVLLEGPRGIGKATLAANYAAKILHSNTARILERSHPDLFILERRYDEKTEKYKKEISIEDARNMRAFLTHTPAEGSHRVVIVDSADELRNEAANCILKVVEEPPKNAVIILLSHGGYILPTIRSRCVSIRLQPLNDSHMCQIISRLMANVTDSDVQLLCQVAEGSPGTAKMIYENEGLWILGELAEIFHRFPQTDYLQLAKFADRVAKNEKGWTVFCTILDWLLATIAKHSARNQVLNILHTNLNTNVNLLLLTDVFTEWHSTQNNTDVYNLDHKQVIVNTLLKIADCWS